MQPGKEGGTWLAMNKHGRIGVLLNVGQSSGDMAAVDPSSTRGLYAVEWVTNMDEDMKGIFNIVKEKHGKRQSTFRLAVFDTKYFQAIMVSRCNNLAKLKMILVENLKLEHWRMLEKNTMAS